VAEGARRRGVAPQSVIELVLHEHTPRVLTVVAIGSATGPASSRPVAFFSAVERARAQKRW